MCLKHITNTANLSTTIVNSSMDKFSFNKNSNIKFKLNDEDDEDSNEENKFEEESCSNKEEHDAMSKEEQTVICSQCFNKLSLAYINFEQAIRFCPNVTCSQYEKLSFSIVCYDYRKALNKKEVQVNLQFEKNFEDLVKEFVEKKEIQLEQHLLNYSLVEQQKQQMQNEQPVHNVYDEYNNKQSNGLPPLNTLMTTNQTCNDWMDIDLFDQLDQITASQFPSTVSIQNPITQTTSATSITQFVPSQTNQVQESPTENILFDNNFFSEINSILSNDGSNEQPELGQSENTTVLNTNTQIDDFPSFYNPPNMMSDHMFMDISYQQPLGSIQCFAQTNELIPLKPTNQAKLAAQLASEIYSDEFLNSYKEPVDLLEVPVNQLSNSNTEITPKNETRSSGITITRLEKKRAPINLLLKDESSNVQQQFKIIDFHEQDSIKQNQGTESSKSISNDVHIANTSLTSHQPNDKQEKSLLPWEIKNSKKAKPHTNNSIKLNISTPLTPSPNKSIDTSTSKLHQVRNGLITKEHLSKKVNEPRTDLKERGMELKRALLTDSSFLSTLSINKEQTSLIKQSEKSSPSSRSTGGYKNLVLSVLKKKETTA